MRIVSCLVYQHNLWLVAVSVIICGLGSWTTVRLFQHARSQAGEATSAWIFLGAVAAGATIWCTHFVDMLAYEPGVPVAFSLGLTALSLFVAVVMSAVGLAVGRLSLTFAPALGGAIFGAGIAAMHYIGMAAFAVDAVVIWDHWYVSASVFFAVTLGALAIHLAANSVGIRSTLVAVATLILAIVCLHLTAMAAMTIVPFAPTAAELTDHAAHQILGYAIAGVGLLVVGTGLASHIVDLQSRERAGTRQRYLMESSVDGMVVELDGRVLETNSTFEGFVGLPRSQLTGRAIAEFLADQPDLGATTAFSTVLRSADGTAIPVELVSHNERGPQGASGATIHAVRDLRPRLMQEQKMIHLARNDSLTGLANRHWFREEMQIALRRIDRDKPIALLWLDLDRFKEVNDTYGHPVGDELLRIVAQRIKHNVRHEDAVGRMGGDEFAILELGAEQPHGATILAERLIAKLSEPYEINGQQLTVGVSIGVTVAPHDGIETDALIKKADLALYSAKTEGRGVFRFFEQGMDEKAHVRRALELDLKSALALQQFELFYQPQVDATTRTLRSFEALLRWRHPERGLVPPLDFIPVAEEIGLMSAIGTWVLRQACIEAQTWPQGIGVAVNVSATQFASNSLEQAVTAALDASGLSPLRLELEITESVLLQDTEKVIETMGILRSRGIKIAMDDFGTGYSSLNYLSRFPIDKIKIDRSFVQHSADDKSSLAVIRAVVGLTGSLGMASTAEGVETLDQLDLLQAEGCTECQGYYFSKPIPASGISKLIESLSERLDLAA